MMLHPLPYDGRCESITVRISGDCPLDAWLVYFLPGIGLTVETYLPGSIGRLTISSSIKFPLQNQQAYRIFRWQVHAEIHTPH